MTVSINKFTVNRRIWTDKIFNSKSSQFNLFYIILFVLFKAKLKIIWVWVFSEQEIKIAFPIIFNISIYIVNIRQNQI